jgi:hypothetical protein
VNPFQPYTARPIKEIRITAAEFLEFCDLRQQRRWDWPAVFSANPKGDVWRFVRYGYTAKDERDYVNGCSPLLDRVAGIYNERREECGRFFIDERGAFFKLENGQEIQFIRWNSGKEVLQTPRQYAQAKFINNQVPYEEMRKRIMENRRKKR